MLTSRIAISALAKKKFDSLPAARVAEFDFNLSSALSSTTAFLRIERIFTTERHNVEFDIAICEIRGAVVVLIIGANETLALYDFDLFEFGEAAESFNA